MIGTHGWQAHRCSTSGGCLSHLAKASPALLDELRALLVEAAEAAAATKEREAVMPVRTAVKVRRRMWAMGKVSSSPAMEQALAATASLPTDLPPSTPAEAGTEVWRALQSRGVCVKGCRDFCKGYVGSSNNFGYRQSARSGGPSRAAGVDIKRRGDNLMSPEEVVNRRCCAADCTPALGTDGVQAIRDKWFSLPVAKRFDHLVELVWDDVLGSQTHSTSEISEKVTYEAYFPKWASTQRMILCLNKNRFIPARSLGKSRASLGASFPHASAETLRRRILRLFSPRGRQRVSTYRLNRLQIAKSATETWLRKRLRHLARHSVPS